MSPFPISFLRELSPSARRALGAAFLGWTLDAFDFVLYLMAIPKLREHFGFGADVAGLLATASLLSSAAGGVLFGWVADRFGRTRALSATILVYSLASLGSATAGSVTELLLWRTLLGFGLGGEWSAGSVLVSESVPAVHRGKAIGLMQSGWAIGYLAAALAAAAILPALGWRALFLLGVAPALLVFWIRRRVAEPLVFERGARAPSLSAGAVLRTLLSPPHRARIAVATLLSACVMFGYWGLFTWLPAFLASPVASGGAGLGLVRSTAFLVPMQLGAFAGYLSFGFVADRFGRRPTFAAYLFAAAALVPLYGSLARSPSALFLLGPLVGFFGHGYFSLFGAQLAELFPTSLRGTAQGLCYNGGRALSAVAPWTVGVAADRHGIGSALALTSAFFLLGAAVVSRLPETRGTELS